MTGAGSVSLREIGRVKSAATRVALLPVVDLAGYTANTAFWLARAAANLEVVAARSGPLDNKARPCSSASAKRPTASFQEHGPVGWSSCLLHPNVGARAEVGPARQPSGQ